MSNTAATRLERAREELLDLTLRNCLLNAPRHRVRAEVFKLLVRVDADQRDSKDLQVLVDKAHGSTAGVTIINGR